MDETYNVKAIILNRRPVGECDSRIIVYSRESGKLELTARGAKKIKSKLAGHLEPISLTNIMVVRGRRYDYVGAAVSENCYGNIKNDLAKLPLAARAVKIVDQIVKPGVAEKKIFELLKDYLEVLDVAGFVISAQAGIQKEISNVNFSAARIVDHRLAMLTSFFTLKFLAELGHQPELSVCVSCSKKILPGKNRFDLARGGLVCGRCVNLKDANQLAVSDDGIKLLRLALKSDFSKLAKVKINKKLGEEIEKIVNLFFKYSF